MQLVSGTYFPMLGVPAYMGRMLNDDDDKTEGNHPVAVISYNGGTTNWRMIPMCSTGS